ncbi:MAG: rod shape-determining protein MreC [Aristaeellaceae bacterium]
MAKRNHKHQPRPELLPDPDELYFDDDLDTVTRGLPSEEEALPQEDAPEEMPQTPTEGVGRIGVRMVGLPPEPESFDDADAEEADGLDDASDEEELVYAAPRRPREAEDEDESLTPRQRARKEARNARAQSLPPSRAQQRRQTRVIPEEENVKARHPKLRVFLLSLVTVLLLGSIGMMLLHRTMMPNTSLLELPENVVSSSVGPVQSFFSHVTESIADYFRTIKLRSNIEQAYNDLLEKNEELAIQAAFANEYARRLSQYESIDEEMGLGQNELLNPLRCQVIGREQGNYFSTFTIDQGSRQGIEPYMAVTIGGALVGYTEEVYASTSTVRTIIDSGASIAALIQSSRDQGTVRGTLGVDGTAMCRMYYLPADHLPRPGDIVVTSGIGMSFPKGLPIGTVRESTRGMEENKQYIVVEPYVDFEHLEFVIVLRYKPTAGAVEGREAAADYTEFEATVTARPYPTLRIGTTLRFGETATPVPTVSVTPSPTPTVSPTPSPTPTASPTPAGTVYEYQSILMGPTATPTATPTPSPTPVITIDPSQLTWEDD